MVLNFMMDGMPIVYYGQEQSFSGGTDPVCNKYLVYSCGHLTPLV
jgi:glycosidase